MFVPTPQAYKAAHSTVTMAGCLLSQLTQCRVLKSTRLDHSFSLVTHRTAPNTSASEYTSPSFVPYLADGAISTASFATGVVNWKLVDPLKCYYLF